MYVCVRACVCVYMYAAMYISLFCSGGWDTSGVTSEISQINNTIICNSSHLTSFAVLLAVEPTTMDEPTQMDEDVCT